MVAGCDDSLLCRSRLWQPPSMVSTSSRADRRCICRRRLRLCRVEDRILAYCRGYFVDIAREFLCTSFLFIRATALRIVRCSTSRCWLGIKQNYRAGCANRCRGHGRPNDILLCTAQGLAFPGKRRHLRWYPERQPGGNSGLGTAAPSWRHALCFHLQYFLVVGLLSRIRTASRSKRNAHSGDTGI